MALANLEWLVQQCQRGDAASRDRLLTEQRGFVQRVVAHYCRRPVTWENDDELSIGLLAFNEAIDTFDAQRGRGFVNHARTVMHHRLVDHFRRERRHREQFSLEAPVAAGTDPWGEAELHNPAEVRAAWSAFSEAEALRERAEEIRRYGALLGQFGLSLADVKASCPKHQDTRQRLHEATRTLANQPHLARQFLRDRRLPLAELTLASGLSRKVLETGRRYIVALALVLLHPEFDHMRGFIGLGPATAPVAAAKGGGRDGTG